MGISISLYVLILVIFGMFISYQFGRALKEKSGCLVVVALGIISIILGLFIAFAGDKLRGILCMIDSMLCISEDNNGMWTLVPIMLSPLYLIAMYVPKEK